MNKNLNLLGPYTCGLEVSLHQSLISSAHLPIVRVAQRSISSIGGQELMKQWNVLTIATFRFWVQVTLLVEERSRKPLSYDFQILMKSLKLLVMLLKSALEGFLAKKVSRLHFSVKSSPMPSADIRFMILSSTPLCKRCDIGFITWLTTTLSSIPITRHWSIYSHNSMLVIVAFNGALTFNNSHSVSVIRLAKKIW